eukprot:XP_027326174.1 butyrophilin subfamily 3 member A1-like [Anas platyrhynchos]
MINSISEALLSGPTLFPKFLSFLLPPKFQGADGGICRETELPRDGLSAGSLDLRITGLRPSDDGQYVCTVEDGHAYDEAIVELEVSAWSMPMDVETHSQDQEGLFEIEGAVIVTGSVEGPLSCVVRNSRLQQERESSLHIAVKVTLDPDTAHPMLVLSQDNSSAPVVGCDQLSPLLTAWRKFLLPHNTVKVTLDPDTAHPMLVLSQDNSSVRWKSEWQQVPDTPERFHYWWCVLGREEFREGRHCWLVEVEGERLQYSWWAVGVARASMERKKWINMSPEEGIWAVQYDEGQLMSLTSPHMPLSLSPIPTRIWVCLDCTQGQVSFINADNGVEIFTFTAASFNGESIHPWFWLRTEGIQLCLRDSTL